LLPPISSTDHTLGIRNPQKDFGQDDPPTELPLRRDWAGFTGGTGMSEGFGELNKPLELSEIAKNSFSVISVSSVVNHAGIGFFKNP
jgi:hypothetical protein